MPNTYPSLRVFLIAASIALFVSLVAFNVSHLLAARTGALATAQNDPLSVLIAVDTVAALIFGWSAHLLI